ncbi:hypothetical protein [Ruegeria sp. HKCCD6119]|nr:hypothetical protein [Ruegeria sp. HKCCD6119]
MEEIIVLAHLIKEESEKEMTQKQQDELAALSMELICLLGTAEAA